jgi:hypothetical protein
MPYFGGTEWRLIADKHVPADVVKTGTARGAERSFLITPAVVRETRRHLGCDSLTGAEFELEGGDGTAGSHLEDFLFFGDLMCGWIYSTDTPMSPTAFGQAVMSNVSLAVLEDLGFYVVNWDRAGVLMWASGGGCRFANETCSQYMESTPGQRFFLGFSGQACLPDRCVVKFLGVFRRPMHIQRCKAPRLKSMCCFMIVWYCLQHWLL